MVATNKDRLTATQSSRTKKGDNKEEQTDELKEKYEENTIQKINIKTTQKYKQKQR